MSRRGTLTVAAIVALLALAVDQATKAWAAASLPRGREVTAISGWLWFRLTTNSGVTLGLFSGHNLLVLSLALLVLIAVAMVLLRGQTGGSVGAGALGAIAGGAVGNLVDRVRLGGVTDFIEVHLWPTDFNLADAAIRVGVVVFLLTLLRDFVRARRSPAAG